MVINNPEVHDKPPEVVQQYNREPVSYKVEPIQYDNQGNLIQKKPSGTLIDFEVF
jgi:hypothetical protein